jgi:hypothetical protein
MSLPLSIKPIGKNVKRVPVLGISEWQVWFHDPSRPIPDDETKVIDECIEAHLAVDIDQIVWNCGRSVLDYWSELPNVTRIGDGPSLGERRLVAAAAQVMKKLCPLRRAIHVCRRKGMPILGRLAMQRHYGSPGSEPEVSRFSSENPQFHEVSRLGKMTTDKLCFALDEVQQERMDILLEIQRIGVDALVLDYARQIPILKYHPALVDPYIRKTGNDPRKINTGNPDDYMDWFQYRADVLTGFMQKLRSAVRQQEQDLGRACPIIARVPDSAEWVTLAFGLDLKRWFAEDLIDGTMLTPFPLCVEDSDSHPEYHIPLAHKYGKICIGGVGASRLTPEGEMAKKQWDLHYLKPVYQTAHRQYQAGADAMSLYQTESTAREEFLKPTFKEIGFPKIVAGRVQELPDPDLPPGYGIGYDYHSWIRHSLTVEQSKNDGHDAL